SDSRPLVGVSIIAADPSGVVLATATTARDGRYALETLPEGTYSVTASAAGYRDSVSRTLTVHSGDRIGDVQFGLTAVATSDAEPSAVGGGSAGTQRLQKYFDRIKWIDDANQRVGTLERFIDTVPTTGCEDTV